MAPHPRERAPAVASFTEWWTDRYTRGLPPEVRDRRIAEVAADVFDHATAASGGGGRNPGAAIAWRTVRGVAADMSWRRQEKRAMRTGGREPSGSRFRNAWAVATQAWFAPLAVIIGLFDLALAWGVATEPDGKMPGQAVGPIVMGALGVALFVGLWMRWRSRSGHPGSPVNPSVDGSGKRSWDPTSRGSLADGLIVVATLPALAFFWMVIPPLVAVAVIAGVAGVGGRVHTA